MDAKMKPTFNPQNDQTKTDSDRDERAAPKFHVQTGICAGGFVDNFLSWWDGVSAGFNLFDQSTGAGG